MRLLHTADWHLGQTLHGLDRGPEHARFLAWLLDRLESEAVDALLIAGDVFDVASPSSAAQRQYYGFLADARARRPDLDIVVVGGNHDSAARLQAPAELLERLGIRVVGGVTVTADGDVDLDALVATVRGADGLQARIAAIPFLRPRDLPGTRVDTAGQWSVDSVVDAHRRLVHAVVERARGDGPVVATGHCYMVGGQTSDESERRIQVGYQAALPADVYPDDVAYVALGHLHRAQTVEGHPHIRYSGSPIPLSMTEREYAHQVIRVDVGPEGLREVTPLFIPRARAFEAIPETHAEVEEVLALLSARKDQVAALEDDALEPLIEVRVRVSGREPQLRARIEDALAGQPGRLARLSVERPTTERDPSPPALESLQPEQVLSLLWSREHEGEVPAALVALFHELLEEAEGSRDADGGA